jgi:chaperonin GroEL
MGIVAAQGDPRKLREHIAGLRLAFAETRDVEPRAGLRTRIGKLMGGSAILWIGAHTESDIAVRKENAERTANALRSAMLEGSVPGGGTALLACRPTLNAALKNATDPDERAACSILLRALEEPARTIIANAGYDPGDILAEIKHGEHGCGFDVRTGEVTGMVQAGILDLAAVLRDAVRTAVDGAGLALTVDVLVHRRRLPEALLPG